MTDSQSATLSAAERLGAYLKNVRVGLGMSLREVEESTQRQVSNGYLSQLENGKIAKPSPHVLHTLASVYDIAYGKLMEIAGYVSPGERSTTQTKHGRAATYAVENLTAEEETELLKYLAWFRAQRVNHEKT